MKFTPRSAAAFSIGSNTLLVGAKLVVGLITGSVSVLSEALHSSMDLLAAIIAFFSVSVSSRPPDREHQYGHGKIENVSGVIEAVLILAAAVLIVVEAIKKIIHGGEVEQIGLGLLVMGLSVVLNTVVARILFTTAKKFDSIALEADAHHLSTDVFTSLGVFGGLLLVKFTGLHLLDPIVAIAVAVLIGWLGFDVLRRSFVDLLDLSLPPVLEKRIREVIEDHRTLYVDYHKMRSRKAGSEKYIDLHLVVCRDDTVQNAHALCDHIEKEIERTVERTHMTTHLEPCSEPEEACDECGLKNTIGPKGGGPPGAKK